MALNVRFSLEAAEYCSRTPCFSLFSSYICRVEFCLIES